MEWQQFEYFRTLAQMEHVTKAAEALSITQPALSRSIARFEEEIGAPLFERQGRSIKLNKYGKLFLKRVDIMMKEFELGKKGNTGITRAWTRVRFLWFFAYIKYEFNPRCNCCFPLQISQYYYHLKAKPLTLLTGGYAKRRIRLLSSKSN